jgi:hypothetical protein
MPWVWFERTIPVSERAKTVHTLDLAVIVIGINSYKETHFLRRKDETAIQQLKVTSLIFVLQNCHISLSV